MTDARPAPATAPLPTPAARSRSLATDVALVSSFAAFIAVCAILPGIPTGTGVPITLQTFGVILTGLVLGWRRGALATLLYVAVGLAGVPVFAGGAGGLGVLAGASVGYLLAFPLGAALAGWLAGAASGVTGRARYLVLVASGLVASALTIHPLGILGMVVRIPATWAEAFGYGAVYFPGDVLKTLLAAAVATAVFAHYPDLLRRR
ncbi:biotin transporter BioY [Cellulomonas gilvus]|uniref:Biotin transporter n=1 Tax=Cellulomonas gilvus (strain ATCC 13127 / NRRL B-14078) TaxID=593907 RepID=F8A7L0_CELGA|nr:biotin transporter BioY [Cellulomonas gilvus]AEI12412.1 BioY protein [Cellulomonas gilvus ATCC 13127]